MAPWRPTLHGRAQQTHALTENSTVATQSGDSQNGDIVRLAATIVAAYVAKNSVKPSDLATLIQAVHTTLAEIRENTR